MRLARGVLGLLMMLAVSAPAWAQGVRISAQVDKTTVDLGAPLTLTITIEGDFAQVNLKPFEFPKVFQVLAQSRASNLSLEVGGVKRSMSLVYVLLPQEPGTFQLGPFQVMHRREPLLTDPIEITVNKPVLPPSLQPHQRFTL